MRLYCGPNEYTPDFVVETEAEKLLVEVKDHKEVDDVIVQAKKDAAVKWCHYANDAAGPAGGKPWRYLLIPDTAINSSLELKQALADYAAN